MFGAGVCKAQLEPASAVGGATCADPAVVCCHDSRGDGQAQAAAATFTGPALIKPDKPFKNPFPVPHRHRRAVVIDRDERAVVSVVQPDADPGHGVPVGVVQDIAHDPAAAGHR